MQTDCKKSMSGWGRFPVIESVSETLEERLFSSKSRPVIAAGNLRSYGDACLAPVHFSTLQNNRFVSFDKDSGLLCCEAGTLLSDIIKIFLPHGWFLKVSPGTKFITVGGAIASDIHGKNHHMYGCFSECLESFEILISKDEVLTCSRDMNSDLFHATCGGMGLTGIIKTARFYLKRVRSKWIDQTTYRASNLNEIFQAFEHYKDSPYSVAWIDCLANGSKLGRSVFKAGDFSADNDYSYREKKGLSVPFNLPKPLLNKHSVRAFNSLTYHKAGAATSYQKVDLDSFFYPLDSISHWNRIYGREGFVQLQFILPINESYSGIKEILNQISISGMGSFLALLKLYGPQNNNWLSFPMEGYSLALDFKMQPGLQNFLRKLIDQAIELNGRIYLAKDALMTREQFDKSYPKADEFRKLRKELNLEKKLQSVLSNRLGL